MASRVEARVVYAAGVAQGIVLVTFPAASTVFTDPHEYDLSSTQYGALFLPQVITAIASALLGARLARRFTIKRVYLGGLVAGLLSMATLILSQFFTGEQTFAYVLLLVATGLLGAGFGLSVPALNTFAAAFHPEGVDRSVLILNALLGVGTVLAPVLAAIFLGLIGFWQGLPLISVGLLVALIMVSVRLPLRVAPPAEPAPSRTAIPRRFWVYAAFALLYGICETVNGNWSQLDMTTELGASTTVASFALTAFWGMVTVGRIFFAAVRRWVAPRLPYQVLPFVLAGAFVLIASLQHGDGALGVVTFGLAGLGCSALLPLTISFGQEEMTAFSGGVAGGVIAFYQMGYGIAAFGVGPLHDAGVELTAIYGYAAAIALVLGGTSLAVARRRPSPSSLHPNLGHAS
jgi:MFS family permease